MTRIELGSAARFDPDHPAFELLESPFPEIPGGCYHLDWKEAEQRGAAFYRQDDPLAVRLLDQSLSRHLGFATLEMDYAGHGAVVSALKPFIGRSGWIAVGTLEVESVDASEFVLVAGEVDVGAPLDDEQCQKLLGLPVRVLPPSGTPPRPEARLEESAARCLEEVARRNALIFDEEVGKLDRWSADLKDGLERELKELDQRIREAGREAALAQTLAGKVEAQRAVRQLESERNRKRRELFDAQDAIDRQRVDLIGKMEKQLACRHRIASRFVVRWTLS